VRLPAARPVPRRSRPNPRAASQAFTSASFPRRRALRQPPPTSCRNCTAFTNNRVRIFLLLEAWSRCKPPGVRERRNAARSGRPMFGATMRIERLFNVLVLGGAALALGCAEDDVSEEEAGASRTMGGAGGTEPAAGAGGTAGTGIPSSDGTVNGGAAGGGAPPNGGAGSGSTSANLGGTPAAGGSAGGDAGGGEMGSSAGSRSEAGSGETGGVSSAGSPGGTAGSASSGGGAGGSAGNAGGPAGSAGSGDLICQLDDNGRGDPRDPCGCPCCWAGDCLNTEEDCCGGFCRGGDDGGGCCGL
jgi:hypothetical protein